MNLRIFSSFIFAAALVFGFTASARADIIANVGEYNGPDSFDFTPGDYPLAPALIGNFTFTIPAGYMVIGGTISGTFGNNDVSPTTAASDYYINNGSIKVAQCDDALTFSAVCDSTGTSPTAWNYTFTSSDLTNLNTELSGGSIDFTVVQNFAVSVQTGTTTLDLVLSPEPSTVFIFCGGLAGITLRRRYRKV